MESRRLGIRGMQQPVHFLCVRFGQRAVQPAVALRNLKCPVRAPQRLLDVAVRVQRDRPAVAEQFLLAVAEPRHLVDGPAAPWALRWAVGRLVVAGALSNAAQFDDRGGDLIEDGGPAPDHAATEDRAHAVARSRTRPLARSLSSHCSRVNSYATRPGNQFLSRIPTRLLNARAGWFVAFTRSEE